MRIALMRPRPPRADHPNGGGACDNLKRERTLPSGKKRPLGTRTTLLRPGLTPYQDAWQLQRRIAADVRAGGAPALILLEHPPVYTLGARGDATHLLASEPTLAALGAEMCRTDRGGDVTFHGPGQIVGYPILNLRALGHGPVWYVRGLEAALIDALSSFGIVAGRSPGRPGVWVGDAKIAAIGVRVGGGVTTHGFALNVNVDLSWFRHIVPCGLADASVTSMQELAGAAFDMRAVEDVLAEALARQFDLELDPAEQPAPRALAEVAGGR
jgi:lipoate-protein ligase B